MPSDLSADPWPDAISSAANHLTPDGRLRLSRWATPSPGPAGVQRLEVDLGPRATPLAHAPASGEGLVTNGHLGVDTIRVARGSGLRPHTHPGDHLLIVVGGSGTVTYDGVVYPTEAGELYMIEGGVPHAVGARTDHVILAVGSPHALIDDPRRMEPREYEEILSPLGDLQCLICDRSSIYPGLLHDEGCGHCPCQNCSVGGSHHDAS